MNFREHCCFCNGKVSCASSVFCHVVYFLWDYLWY